MRDEFHALLCDSSRRRQRLTNVALMVNWGCHIGCNGWCSKPNDGVLGDETSRNINTDKATWWKVTGKEQDPTLAYIGCGGGGAGNDQCPFLPILGGSWKLNTVSYFQPVWHQIISGPAWNNVLKKSQYIATSLAIKKFKSKEQMLILLSQQQNNECY